MIVDLLANTALALFFLPPFVEKMLLNHGSTLPGHESCKWGMDTECPQGEFSPKSEAGLP